MAFYTRPSFAQLFRHKGFTGKPSEFTVIRRALHYGFKTLQIGEDLPEDMPVHRLRAYYNMNRINPKFLEQMLEERRAMRNRALAAESVGSVTFSIKTGKALEINPDLNKQPEPQPEPQPKVEVEASDLTVIKSDGEIPITDEEMEQYPGEDLEDEGQEEIGQEEEATTVAEDETPVMPVLAAGAQSTGNTRGGNNSNRRSKRGRR